MHQRYLLTTDSRCCAEPKGRHCATITGLGNSFRHFFLKKLYDPAQALHLDHGRAASQRLGTRHRRQGQGPLNRKGQGSAGSRIGHSPYCSGTCDLSSCFRSWKDPREEMRRNRLSPSLTCRKQLALHLHESACA